METFEADDGHVVVRLDRGDMALESIERACERHGVDTGAVVSGIGTFSNLNIHYVNRTDLRLNRPTGTSTSNWTAPGK